MKFYSEDLKQFFDTAEECEKAEEKEKAKQEAEKRKAAKLKEEKATRKKEVEDALAHTEKLIRTYIKDYGTFTTTSAYDSLIDFMCNHLF